MMRKILSGIAAVVVLVVLFSNVEADEKPKGEEVIFFEDFEGGPGSLSEEWSINQLWGRKVVFTGKEGEVIDGKYSLKLDTTKSFRKIGKFKIPVKWDDYDHMVERFCDLKINTVYELSFDYRILKRPPGVIFVCELRGASGYYQRKRQPILKRGVIPVAGWGEWQWGTLNFTKGEIGKVNHAKARFSGKREKTIFIFWDIIHHQEEHQGAVVVIDNIKLVRIGSKKELAKEGIPPSIELLWPCDGMEVTDFALDFSWQRVKEACKYELQIFREGGTSPIRKIVIPDKHAFWRAPGYWMPHRDELLPAGSYWWRVRGINWEGKKGKWSKKYSFKVNSNHIVTPPIVKASPSHPLFMPGLPWWLLRKTAMWQGVTPTEVVKQLLSTLPKAVREHISFRFWGLGRGRDADILIELFGKGKELDNIPIYWNLSHGDGILSEVEYVFQHCPNVHLTLAEWGAGRPEFFSRLCQLCAKYGRDMFRIGKNECATAGISPALKTGNQPLVVESLSKYSHYIVMGFKMNNLEGPYLNQSSKMGFWLAGMAKDWGIDVESWYFGPGGPIGKANEGYFTLGNAATLMGQLHVLGLAGGATYYQMENAWDGSWIWKRCTKENPKISLTPTGKKIFLPLYEDIIKHKLIPTKEEVLDKIKVGIVAENIATWGEYYYGDLTPIYQSTYGIQHYPDMIPNTGRYYFIPVFPIQSRLTKLPMDKMDIAYPRQFTTKEGWKKYFDQLYPPTKSETFCVTLGKKSFIIHTQEMCWRRPRAQFAFQDKDEYYEISFNNGIVNKIEGKVRAGEYLIIKDEDNQIFIHANGLTDRKGEFVLIGKTPKIKVVPEEAVINIKRYNDKTKLTISYKKGAVRIFVR